MSAATKNSSDPIFSILVLGDTRREEFARARRRLDRLGQVTDAPTVDEALAMLDAESPAPDVIVVAQSYPGEFPAEALDRLRGAVPLARIVGMLGSWCEGETRTGQPWPATIRLYWHQWIAQAEREIESLLAGAGSSWSLPDTASDEERLCSSVPLASRQCSHGREGLVAIHTDRLEIHDCLAAAVTRQGFSAVWLRPSSSPRVQGVRLALFDATAATDREIEQLRRLAKTLGPNVPIIALLDFPRIENHNRALTNGAAAVLSKPLLLDDLFWQLDEVLADAA